jgi:cytochrome c biogenesis protein CcmG, thiol:disulfide interchange protein DsbE
MRRSKRILLMGLLAGCLPAFAHDVGSPAPEVRARLLDSNATFSLAAQRGKVVILNFWATWCTPCLAEMPALETYYARHRDDGLVILAISMDNARQLAAVRATAGQYSFQFALHSQAEFKELGRIWRMPSTFVVDRSGILRRHGSIGEAEVTLESLESLVTPLLAQPAAKPQRAQSVRERPGLESIVNTRHFTRSE